MALDSSHAAHAQQNRLGAVIFILYVVAALLLTLRILKNLWSQYASLPQSYKESIAKKIWALTTLAVMSFSVLSFHMLSFLIVRHGEWKKATPFMGDSQPVQDQSLVSGIRRGFTESWIWLSSSNLFEDFATTICASRARYFWTSQALLMTMAWSVFMSVEGTRRGTPGLWTFTFISQILPVSFAMNLFFLAMTIHDTPTVSASRTTSKIPGWVQYLYLLFYFALLFCAPRLVSKQIFLTILFLIRFWIFLPFMYHLVTPSESRHDAGLWRPASMLGSFLLASCLFLALHMSGIDGKGGGGIVSVIQAINDDPSVSALGYDYVLSVASIVAWLRIGS